jgi:hypothetical protein
MFSLHRAIPYITQQMLVAKLYVNTKILMGYLLIITRRNKENKLMSVNGRVLSLSTLSSMICITVSAVILGMGSGFSGKHLTI